MTDIRRRNRSPLPMAVVNPYPSPVDLAWAAGLWDGEGSVGHYPNQSKGYVLASMTQNDRGVLDRLRDILPFGNIYQRKREDDARYAFSVHRRMDVMLLALMLWPHLSEVKRDQFDRALGGAWGYD